MTSFYPASALDLGQPFGRMVDVDGRAVHIVEMGAGAPTVWLENGWLATCLGWQPFQRMLAAHTRVCAYDRAGIGFSDPVDSQRCAQNEADEFAELLDAPWAKPRQSSCWHGPAADRSRRSSPRTIPSASPG